MRALAKRVVDGGLRRLGLVRTVVAAAQTVDAVYLGQLGRLPEFHERVEAAGALRTGEFDVLTLIDNLGQSANGQAWRWHTALPMFLSAGYVAPQPHFERLVEIAFRAVLDRPPEPQALIAYENALRSGVLSVEDFVAELMSTREAADRILSQGYLNQDGHLAKIVDALFFAVLDRPPEDGARTAYVEALRSGRLSIADFAVELIQSGEAANRMAALGYLDHVRQLPFLVDAVFLAVLGRPPAEARAAYAEALRSEHLTIQSFVDELASSQEAKDRILSAGYLNLDGHLAQIVDVIFVAALGRTPEDTARDAYVEALRSGRLSAKDFADELIQNVEAADRLATLGYFDSPRYLGQVVDAVFRAVLDRPPEDDARTAYAEALRSETLTVETFIDELASTAEAAARPARSGHLNRQDQLRGVIAAVFKAALGRSADEDAISAFVAAIEGGALTLEGAIEELSNSEEARQRALKLVRPVLKAHGYFDEGEHYNAIFDVIYESIIGRPAEDTTRAAFVSELVSERLTPAMVVEELMNSAEVKLRVRNFGLPDVLEGIYRAVMGAPESDPSLRALIRSASSRHTYETIKKMCLSAETSHYLMEAIINEHRQQFLDQPSVGQP